ncbi:MAG TPA: DUF2520 domain-containing protein [Solirubrobacterales bacterium]|nr:DUF2520 domain-containing protein [Solirubrobacterales bacterium]
MNERTNAPQALTIVGPGRVGNSIARAATEAGVDVVLTGRDFTRDELASRTVLLCVPDSAIARVAEGIAKICGDGGLPRLAGHTSGATTLDPLLPCQTEGAFSLHPLQTVPDRSTDLKGCPGAVAGSNALALATASALAGEIGMEPFEVAESDRAIYHAAASIAANYLVTLEQTAADLLGGIGVANPREVLAPLVRRSLSNWESLGADALTGPIARGDTGTVEAHRAALEVSAPEILRLYDAMAERTRAMANTAKGASVS